MRKFYIGLILLAVFLAALATDWNIRQESARQEDSQALIETRQDDLLVLEVGYPGGKGPPAGSESKRHTPPPTPEPELDGGPRTVIGPGEEGALRQEGRNEPGAFSPYVYYEVKPGDTLSEIAQRLLGTSTRAEEIKQLNQIDDPKRLKAGERLKVPAR